MKSSGQVLTTDAQQIFYNHYMSGHKEVVIIAHGFFNSKESALIKSLCEKLQENFDVIAFDFRGHGESEGLFYWTSKEYLDLQAILNYAQDKYEKIGVIGFSLGAATSIITLAKTDVARSLIAVSPPTQLEKIDYRFWGLDVENDILYNLGEGRIGKGVRPGPFWLEKDMPINVISELKMPVLFIHGDADWIIKPWHSEMLFEKANTEKRIAIIKNGPHAEYLMREHENEFLQLIREWFAQTLTL